MKLALLVNFWPCGRRVVQRHRSLLPHTAQPWYKDFNLSFGVRSMRFSKAAMIFSAVLFAATHLAHAQTTFASITGIVTDASGSAVPNATVTAINQQTNIRTSAKSNEAGNYTIAQL